MSKRQSSGGGSSNTLFNYFTKTPPATKKARSAEEEGASTPATPETPRASQKKNEKAKRERPPTKSPEQNPSDSEESPIKPRKKRIRLYPVDSDDSDTENKADNVPETEKGSFVKKLQESFQYESKSPQEKTAKPTTGDKTPTTTKKPAKDEEKALAESASPEEGNWIHCKLDFLKPEKIRDANKRRPDHPEYDPKTLFVPEEFKKTQTPAHRQWWDMKSSHYDCVLFFKVGKFYELFHMDAAVGVNELGFSYMRGEYAHSGFPESAYPRMAATLVSKGYKVARVEQTETPEMMQERCKKFGLSSKYDKVVQREICQVTCKGIQVGTLLEDGPHEANALYLTAVTEEEVNGVRLYGVCLVDTSIGLIRLGQFEDDTHSSRLLTMFAHHPPALVLYERTSPSISKLISIHCHNARREPVPQFWTADRTLEVLADKHYRTSADKQWPEGLKPFLHDGDILGLTPAAGAHLAVKALGACVSYLTDTLLDIQVLAMAQFETYLPPDVASHTLSQESDKSSKEWEGGNTMVLDAITLRNLKIINEQECLFDKLNYCVTPMGKRLLRQWVCWPSCRRKVIAERQEAVAELYANSNLCKDARELLSLLPDIERMLAKIHTLGNYELSRSHPDARAIFFDERKYTKKKVQDFLRLVNGLASALRLGEVFSGCESALLRRVTQHPPDGRFPDYMSTLKVFESSFNHSLAEKEGKIVPSKGVDEEYDSVLEKIAEIEKELQEYLKEQERHFKCKVKYVGSDRKRYQLEVAESAARRAGPDHHMEGSRKGFKRFCTPTTKDLLSQMMAAEEQKTSVLQDLSRRIFERFSKHRQQWEAVVGCVSTLDVLMSLAEFASQLDGDVCMPEFVGGEDGKPYIEIVNGRHPCMATSAEYIPNDTALGGPAPSLLLLTGPNMGGKSTLMRQVAIITLTAHLGCHVPASSCSLSLVDRIFTRLGANDDIISGQSTFLVEMSETAAIVKHATRHSLVLCDELGRGTSTYDGCSLASGVAAELADRGCLVVFSTHYHHLVQHLSSHPNVLLGHMACMAENEDSESEEISEESIIFLYKLAPGPCPKSYGFNAAKLAGIPVEIIRRGKNLAEQMERNANSVRTFKSILSGKPGIREMLLALKI